MAPALRVALGHQVLNGIAAALGLLFVTVLVRALGNPWAASVAAVGAIVCIPPDTAAPLRGKLLHLLPAALFGVPLFMAMQLLKPYPLHLALLLVPATFVAFLAGAWGRRGAPLAISFMFAMVFSMAVAAGSGLDWALVAGGWFALGAALYIAWAVLANAVLNARYRSQILADTLLVMAALMRTQARQLAPAAETAPGAQPLIGRLMQQQAALADQLQAARDLVLEAPRTPRRRQLAGMLLHMLEMRDHLLASELDLDTLRASPDQAGALEDLRRELVAQADAIEAVADALLLGRLPPSFASPDPRSALVDAEPGEPPQVALARSLRNRIGRLHEETRQLVALARGEVQADVAVVRTAWRLFVSPTSWSWKPLRVLRRWDAPLLRHALRAALAIACAYALTFVLPWKAHGYWLLLTIVVVLRGSLAQTLERRNSRVAGTVLGCVIAGALLWADPPAWSLLLVLSAAQAVAHAFALRKYVVTAVAATILSLLQAHMLGLGANPVFDVAERMADTVLGVAIAWLFAYVLPTWERGQLPALVRRTLLAQGRHAREALGLAQLDAVDDEPELGWRLARREAYDSLSALVQATQRALVEPRAVRPPLDALERLLAHSYLLLAQLTAAKTVLLRRERLDSERLRPILRASAEGVGETLAAPVPSAAPGPAEEAPLPEPPPVPESGHDDLTPWVERRLALADRAARQVQRDAHAVLAELAASGR
ncbi:FUSC family protein [Ramlibacter sp.]|uniref:FUSC family protein n=1 Tax=Ramlibacter sp. TaxID=1917967 RepID=UPI002D6135A5|nr:FUSC family membrane protein [Ramlibacter sp.]HYD75536.1 FUSC family membrane protein [Ramlibacter sp.]